MGADPGAGPVGSHDIVHDRCSFFQDGADELMDQMGMGTAVAAPLGK